MRASAGAEKDAAKPAVRASSSASPDLSDDAAVDELVGGLTFVSRFRLAGRDLVAVFLLLLGTGVSDLAHAQGKLDARYTASLAGVPIGRGAWVIDIADDQYTAAASGRTTGLLRVFASGDGSSAVRGHVRNGNLIPASYASSITTDKRTEELRITLSGGNVKD